MFSKIIKLVAATAVSLGLMGSVALASSGSITGPTGAFSTNQVTNISNRVVVVSKTNNVGVANFNLQGSSSGGVVAVGNTMVGGVHSGSSGNSSTTTTTIVVTNN